MTWLSPSALLFALLAIPILALYLLKLRRRDTLVSSTLLWEQALREQQANTPWQRLRRNLLLILQLLILGALALALARPAVPVPGIDSGSVVLVLDASASMKATDIPPSRFDAARAAIEAALDSLPAGSRATLILADLRPQVLGSGGRADPELRRALAAVQPSSGETDWPAAFALAAGSAAVQGGGEPAVIAVFSDGGIPAGTIPPLPGQLRYIPFGVSGQNLAVEALALRAGAAGLELFTRATNYGTGRQPALLSIYQAGRLIHSESLSIPAGDSVAVLLGDLPNPPGEALFEVRLSPAAADSSTLDPFPLDDAAAAVYTPPRAGQILFASQSPGGNVFIEQILAALPGVSAYRALPDATGQVRLPDPVADPFGLYVLDGVLPAELPPGNLLLVNPPGNQPDNPLFGTSGTFTTTAPARLAGHPFTQDLSWTGIHIQQARQVTLPAWAQALVASPGGPLVFVGEQLSRRVAVLTFDLHDSDLPLHVEFPILMARLVEYLLPHGILEPQTQALGVRPGGHLTLRPALEASEVQIQAPSGRTYRLQAGGGELTFAETLELGFYSVQPRGGAGQEPAHFAVNLFAPLESAIQPAGALQTPAGVVAPIPQPELGQRELWPWLAGAALLVLLLEWWLSQYQQRRPAHWKPPSLRRPGR